MVDTVRSLIESAKSPDRLKIAIFHQLDLTCEKDQAIDSGLSGLVEKYPNVEFRIDTVDYT